MNINPKLLRIIEVISIKTKQEPELIINNLIRNYISTVTLTQKEQITVFGLLKKAELKAKLQGLF